MIHLKNHAWKMLPVLILFGIISSLPSAACAQQGPALSKGQTVYVSLYSNVFVGVRKRLFPLTTTLSVRNTDLHSAIQVLAVEIYDSDGKLIEKLIDKPHVLNKLGTVSFKIEENMAKDDPGANFIVKWKSEKTVTPPIIESIMIGTKGQQGISFLTRGQVIEEEGMKGKAGVEGAANCR